MSKGASTMFIETEKVGMLPIRKSQRVLLRVPLSVSGKVNDEMPFEEESFTISVNAAGGLLQLRKPVTKGQRLKLIQARSGQQEFCIVAHVEPIDGGFNSVGVHFLEPHPEFWHITFPPDDWTPRHPDSKFNKRPQLQNSDVRECVEVGNF
jgi:hypothetical protein